MNNLRLQHARNVLEVGIAWQLGPGRPIYTYMPFTIVFFCSLFRYRHLNNAVIFHDSSYGMFIHDAVHGWLDAPPTMEGEFRVYIVQHHLGVVTIEDFEELLDCCKPQDIPTFDEWIGGINGR